MAARNTREQTAKKLKARYLIIVKGYSQKEASEIVGVTTKTMVQWVKKYNWNEEVTKEVVKAGGLLAFMKDFFAYIRSTSPELLKAYASAWYSFLKVHEADIEKYNVSTKKFPNNQKQKIK
jgi:DNA-binding XRE family transcriptional regulator